MYGIHVRYKNLGQLMREGRERKQLSLNEAALMLGLTNKQYLWRCETGTSNFSADVLKNALELYRIPVSDSVEAATKDFTDGLGKFLRARS